ncbi:TMV resistance protein N-like [Eucalyptus grandis]|uniref:TMV resistance protein N-like n=1 Tax=Eucalyptus grandis TaxID=71139 RepID=UPI00192ED377|nr:TMV resistance protein N-like [Eucalyptus grandis]
MKKSSEATLSMEIEPEEEYQVFLSFRGPDIRKTFADFLYYCLVDAGIHVFIDDEGLQVGKEIGRELSKALERSRIYIPIFSRNYAASSWCLCEVANMVECTSKSNGKKEILPIFYDVYPDDVKLKSKLYKEAIAEHEKKFASEELKRWENALVEVAHIKGWEFSQGHG